MVTPFADGQTHQSVFNFFQLRRTGQIFLIMQLHTFGKLLRSIFRQRMLQRDQIGFLTMMFR
ncbi:hypothetical protein D3C80_1914500 [compost metagenome]